jgi:type I site-specific restriction endonuclease
MTCRRCATLHWTPIQRLCFIGQKLKTLAVVEARKTAADAAVGREQAWQYCSTIQERHNGELPFCFYTSGHDIFFGVWTTTAQESSWISHS